MSDHGNDNIDILRKGAIVAVLVGGVVLLHRFGVGAGSEAAMLALGLVVLGSYTFGELVGAVKLPHITGYLLAGLLLGESAATVVDSGLGALPETLGAWVGPELERQVEAWFPGGPGLPPPFDRGVLNGEVMDQLGLFNTLAVALIALTAGGELKIEALRRGVKTLLGVLGGQTVAITTAIVLLTVVISGQLGAGLALPFLGGSGAALGGLDLTGVLLIGFILASISLATSPAATIAVINSTRAAGPTTQTILSSVVLKDVLVVLAFSVVTALAAAWIDPTDVMALAADAADAVTGHGAEGHGAEPHGAEGHGAHDTDHGHGGDHGAGHGGEPESVGAFIATLAWNIVGSLAIGLLVGLGITAYLRYVGVEILLFLVGLVFTIALAGGAAGLDTTLLFIAAGFAATNFSEEGDHLIHEVEKLGMPVYVVFFTLTGAGLHLDSLVALAPFAGALVAARGFGIWIGVWGGTRLAGGPEPVARYGWLGYISQAGVAIALAGLVAQRFGDTGAALRDLIIAGVAVHEVAGPILLKVALGLTGEIPSGRKGTEDAAPDPAAPPPAERAGLRRWQPPEEVPDPWGEAPETGTAALDRLAVELRADLEALVGDLEGGLLSDYRDEAAEYLGGLRREFLRHHRHVAVALSRDPAGVATRVRSEQAELAERWRDLVLARSAEVASETWSPVALVEAVDDLVSGLPERIEAPYAPETLRGPGSEDAFTATRRALVRAWHGVASSLGGGPPSRSVPVRSLAAYHLGGLLPARLEGLAALLVGGEQHLHRRTRSLFTTITHAYDVLHDVAEAGEDLDGVLAGIRRDVDEEFALARGELDAIAGDATLRTARILGESWREWAAELLPAGTLDLPARSRRYSKVFNQRTKGLQILEKGLGKARRSTAARYDGLALELELVRLEGRIKDLVEQHADRLARNVRGKGSTQVARVESALRDALTGVEELLAEDLPAQDLARALREVAEPLDHVAEDAARSASRLRDQLADDQALAPLLDALLLAARDLTERYTVPTGPEREGEWALPPVTPTAEVPFREVVQAFIESSVTRDLVDLTRALSADAEQLAVTLEEFDRLVAFNVELATGELELLDDGVPESTRELVHEMVVGNLSRARTRLEAIRERSDGWGIRAEEGVEEAVLGKLDTLRAQIQEGRVSELRVRLLREAAAGRRMVRRAGGLAGLLETARDTVNDIAHGTLGPSGLAEAQRVLGIPTAVSERRPDPSTFAEARSTADLPMVYRRLFSDVAMEAGDLLTGRRTELDRARRILDGDLGGRLRAVALVGPAGVGKRALVSAIIRKVDTRDIQRITLSGPVTAGEVEAWFEEETRDRLVVVDGFAWMFSMSPDGMAPLRAFARGLVRDDGRNRWLVHAHTPVWRFANRVAELQDAFAEVIELEPLSPSSLAGAILARHGMSGYQLSFVGDPGLGWQLRTLVRRDGGPTDREREAWFSALHAATGGLLNDALRLWMASIAQVDEQKGVVIIGDIPEGPLEALRSLPDDDLLTLRQVARQGVMSVETHAWLFRTSNVTSEAHLGHLAHLGLLVDDSHGYAVADHLQGPVSRVLVERGWSE